MHILNFKQLALKAKYHKFRDKKTNGLIKIWNMQNVRIDDMTKEYWEQEAGG